MHSSTFVLLLHWFRLIKAFIGLNARREQQSQIYAICCVFSRGSSGLRWYHICFLNCRLLHNSQCHCSCSVYFCDTFGSARFVPLWCSYCLIFFFTNVWCLLLRTESSQASNLSHVRRLSCHHLLWYHLCTLNYFVRLPILTFKWYKFTFGLTFLITT